MYQPILLSKYRTLFKENLLIMKHVCCPKSFVIQKFLCICSINQIDSIFYDTAVEFLKEHHRVLDIRLRSVVRDITDARARNKDELDGILMNYILAIVSVSLMVYLHTSFVQEDCFVCVITIRSWITNRYQCCERSNRFAITINSIDNYC